MAVPAIEPIEDATYGQAISANIRRVVRVLLELEGQKKEWLATQLPLSRTSVFSRMKGETEFTGVELAMMGRVFRVPVQTFFESPDGWLPRLDSNQEPAGCRAQLRLLRPVA